jgi:hypothetical protein
MPLRPVRGRQTALAAFIIGADTNAGRRPGSHVRVRILLQQPSGASASLRLGTADRGADRNGRMLQPRRPAPLPTAPPILLRRRRSRGASAATIAKLWQEANGDRAVFRRRLEQWLRRSGLIRHRSADEDVECLLSAAEIDARLERREFIYRES